MNQYAIIALVWAASLVSVGAWQNSAGHTSERVEWQGREVTELTTANAAIKTLEEAARATERVNAAALDTIATAYEWRLSDATKQRSADLTAIRDGTLKLRDPAAAVRSCGDSMPGIAAGAGGRDGGQGSGLSDAAAEFLLSLASDADAVVEQLGACQAIVRADRAP